MAMSDMEYWYNTGTYCTGTIFQANLLTPTKTCAVFHPPSSADSKEIYRKHGKPSFFPSNNWLGFPCLFFFKLNRSLQKHISIQGTTLCGVSFLPLWCMRSSNERPNMVMASSVSSVGRQVGSPTNRNRFGKRLECLCLMAGLPAQRLWRPWSSARFCKFWAPDQETKASFNAIPAAPGEPKTLVASKRKRQSKI